MTNSEIAMWAALLIFNAAIIRLLGTSLSKVDFRDVLREKGPVSPMPVAAPVAPAAGDAAPPATTPAAADDTSYSRVAGMLGAVVIGCFIWGLGNVILFKAFTTPREISELLDGISRFLLSSSALFAPYAFNQLKDTFRKTP